MQVLSLLADIPPFLSTIFFECYFLMSSARQVASLSFPSLGKQGELLIHIQMTVENIPSKDAGSKRYSIWILTCRWWRSNYEWCQIPFCYGSSDLL